MRSIQQQVEIWGLSCHLAGRATCGYNYPQIHISLVAHEFFGQAAQVAEVLKQLLRGSDESSLLAYQIAFDLVESEHQHFVMEVNKNLPQKKTPEAEPADAAEEKRENAEAGTEAALAAPPGPSEESASPAPAAATGMEMDGEDEGPEESEEFLGRMEKLRQVLVDGFGIDLSLNFLYKMNQTDLLLMKNIKGALETRNSVLHNVTVVAHGYMQAGTTVSYVCICTKAVVGNEDL